MANSRLFLMILVVAILSGCATTNHISIADIKNLQGGVVQRPQHDESAKVEVVTEKGGRKNINFPTDPYAILGVFKTEAIAKGEVTVIEGIFPDIRFGEYFPGSVRGNALAIAGEKEFFCQTVLYRLGEDSRFRMAVIIEGQPDEVRNSKVMALSLRGDYAYDLSGQEFKLDSNFSKNGEERRKFVLENGTLAESVPLVDPAILQEILAWNAYSTPEGILLSPLGNEEVKYIAGINPQYKFMDKLQGKGNFSLRMDPIATMIGFTVDVFRAMDAPATGWDYNSQLPSRRNMGIIFQYVAELRLRLGKTEFALERVQEQAKPTGKVGIAKDTILKPSESTKEFFEKIRKLGFAHEDSIDLAEKVGHKKFSRVKLTNPTIVSSVLIGDKHFSNKKLTWDEPYSFTAEKYEAGNHAIYRIINNGREMWFRIN